MKIMWFISLCIMTQTNPTCTDKTVIVSDKPFKSKEICRIESRYLGAALDKLELKYKIECFEETIH